MERKWITEDVKRGYRLRFQSRVNEERQNEIKREGKGKRGKTREGIRVKKRKKKS